METTILIILGILEVINFIITIVISFKLTGTNIEIGKVNLDVHAIDESVRKINNDIETVKTTSEATYARLNTGLKKADDIKRMIKNDNKKTIVTDVESFDSQLDYLGEGVQLNSSDVDNVNVSPLLEKPTSGSSKRRKKDSKKRRK